MSNVAILSARVEALRAEADEADGHARACRSAVKRIHGVSTTLSGMSVDIGGMRSKSTSVERAKAKAESAAGALRSTRSALDEMTGDLQAVARKYDRKADTARADLRITQRQLEAALLEGTG